MASATSVRSLSAPATCVRLAPRLVLEWLLLASLVALFLQRGFLPGWRILNSDFPNYYVVARLFRAGVPLDRIYEWQWLQRQKDHFGIEQALVGYAPHPPLCFTLVLPFASLPALAAKRCWLVLNLLLLAAVVALLRRMTALAWRHLALLVLLAVVPLANNFVLGQVYVVLLLLTTVALYCWLRRHDGSCGLLLAAGAALKLYPAVFLLYFVRKQHWRAAAALLGGIAVSVIAAILLLGVEPVRTFALEVLPRASRGELMDPYNLRLNSLAALLRHWFLREPGLNPAPLADLPRLYAVLQPLCAALITAAVLARLSGVRRDPQREKVEWALFTALLLFISPLPATYHYVLLITPAIVVIDHALQLHRRLAVALIVSYVLICAPIPQSFAVQSWLAALYLPRLWGVLLFMALVSVLLFESRSMPVSKPRIAKFAAVVALLALPGIWTNWRSRIALHQPGERLSTGSAWMATDPVVAGDRILFTAMLPHGYSVELLSAERAAPLAFPSDAFHPAVSSTFAWAELSDRSSRIVRFRLPGAWQPTTEVPDGEQPSVSPDGRWLAFTRESAGRSSLWVTRVPVQPGSEIRVTPPSFDVLEAAFTPDAALVFSARAPDGVGLYRAKAEARPPRLWLSGPLRYPAVSPDGAWLAFSRRERGSWHLWLRHLGTGAETRLTRGGCNSVSPAWSEDSKQLIYATDCGRGLGLTSLHRLRGDW